MGTLFSHPILSWWVCGCLVTSLNWYVNREKVKEHIEPHLGWLVDYPALIALTLCIALSLDAFLWPQAFTGWYWDKD